MKATLLFLVCVFFIIMNTEAQECYNSTYEQGQNLFKQGKYGKALAVFKAAVNCPDKPANNDLAFWIKEAENKLAPQAKPTSVQAPKTEETIYTMTQVNKEPQFPGGKVAFESFCENEMIYPAEAQNKKIEGIVWVETVISRDGKISQSRVAQSADTKLDKEALRLIEHMPNWIPGEKDGTTVSVRLNIPITFKIEKKETMPLVVEEEKQVTSLHKQSISIKNEIPFKKHQFTVDLGLGSSSDEYDDIVCLNINARYLYAFSKYFAVESNVRFMSDLADFTGYSLLIGPRYTTPSFGRKLSFYITPQIGYGIYGASESAEGLTYGVEIGLNISKHFFVSTSYTAASLSMEEYSYYTYDFTLSNIAIRFGYKF